MDYGFFDGLIDAVFVIKDDRGIVYCNEAAAKICDSSVKRLARGKPIFETIEFADQNLFVMPSGTSGKDEPAPYVEIKFKLKAGKEGKVQIAIQPFTEPSGEKRWVVMMRDVTLEEVLHAKYHKQLEEKEVYIKKLEDAQKQLEAYSKNLEHMVEERTKEVKRAYVMLNAIMNSLGQGFLVFDKDGKCAEVFTKACEDILETIPANKNIWDVLKVKPSELETFHMWLKAVYGEKLPFETIKELGPGLFPHSQDRHIKLDYFPLRTEGKGIENVVVVATDKTSEFLANRALEKEKKFAKMVIKLVTGKKPFSQFLESISRTIQDVKKSVMADTQKIDHEYVFRMLHTLEGEAATYSVTDVWAAARASQEIIEPVKKGQPYEIQDVRSRLLGSLDELKNCESQFLAANKELFAQVGIGQEDKVEISVEKVESILAGLKQKGVSAAVCEELSATLLKEPMLAGLRHYQDVVAAVAEKLNKKMGPVEFSGADVRGYLERYQELFASFVHGFRNAVDHGIEPSEEREMMGKPAAGTLKVSVESFVKDGASWFKICLRDDGKGISPEIIRKKLVGGGKTNASKLSDFEVIQHVFDSGLSTKEEVGEFSGRGIGMNAIKAEAEALGGKAWVESDLGRGSALFVEVPDLPRVANGRAAA